MTSRGKSVSTTREVNALLDSVEIDQLIAQYRAGAKANELARQFKINRDTVFSILKRRGVKRHQRGLPPNQVQEAIVNAYASGLSLAAFGARLSLHPSIV